MSDKLQRIAIVRGDDTNFAGSPPIEIVISSELDLTGCKAHFKFLDFQQDFDEIPENRTLNVVIPHDTTKDFPIGFQHAKVWVDKTTGEGSAQTTLIRTLENKILVLVTNNLKISYGQSIIVTDHTLEVLTEDGIFYLPVFKNELEQQVYRRLLQHEDEEMGGITTELSEELYIRQNGHFVLWENN